MSPHHGGQAYARESEHRGLGDRSGALAAGLGYWRGEANGHERGVLETQATHDARRVDSLAEGWTRCAPTS